ncbi:MAG: transcriptional repressor [Deltaproteobacteria bacterium]|nr:transcriptional repressor [Deltaproteobacteria bacterium]MBW1955392.1 transcriptional repressor [Deltaproteobacteria bacterium]
MTESHKRYSAIVEKLREEGFKLTPQRMAIAKILAHSDGHPSVEDIFGRLKETFPTMSLATVYRNVLVLKSLGEALELGFPDGRNRYDGNRPYPHPHAICIRCRTIVDTAVDGIQDVTRAVADATGFRILTHRLDFFGICRTCQEQNDPDGEQE